MRCIQCSLVVVVVAAAAAAAADDDDDMSIFSSSYDVSPISARFINPL